MQHYNNVHFYGQLTAADAINALSNAHHGNANVAYEGGAREKVANLKETGAETYLKGNKVKKELSYVRFSSVFNEFSWQILSIERDNVMKSSR